MNAMVFANFKSRISATAYRLAHPFEPRWNCPLCGYVGPFAPVRTAAGARPYAECPCCHSRERHRLQIRVMRELFAARGFGGARMLHFAPEPFLQPWFRARVGRYETADLARPDVDHRVDISALPFDDATYDLVYASHVLEHVRDDAAAIRDIHRVLRPGGIAVLPVPIVAPATIEYAAPNPLEEDHVRAPGPDYFERYRGVFARVILRRSDDGSANDQCHIYSAGATRPDPARRQDDVVPICCKDADTLAGWAAAGGA